MNKMLIIGEDTAQLQEVNTEIKWSPMSPIPNHPDGATLCSYITTFNLYDQYCREMRQDLPSDSGWGRGDRPVIYVNWFDAVKFCNWVSLKMGLPPAYILVQPKDEDNVVWIWMNPNRIKRKDSDVYVWIDGVKERMGSIVLPEPSDWEASAKIPKPDGSGFYQFAGSDDLKKVAWYADNSESKTHPVGELQPTPYWNPETGTFDWSRKGKGHFDLYGNTWEWMTIANIPDITEKEWNQWFPGHPFLAFNDRRMWCPDIEL